MLIMGFKITGLDTLRIWIEIGCYAMFHCEIVLDSEDLKLFFFQFFMSIV